VSARPAFLYAALNLFFRCLLFKFVVPLSAVAAAPLNSLGHHGAGAAGSGYTLSFGENAGPTPHPWSPMKLTAAERERLARMRARPCKHGHLRHDARVYRNATGSLWLDCAQCVRDRVNAYRRRVAALDAQAY
jgi:hypothetical protein